MPDLESAESMMIEKLGRYRILEKLGEGTLGPVYKAADDNLGGTVAIRIIGEGVSWAPAERSRFYSEYRPIAALQHPNIVAVHDTGEAEKTPYIVMELLQGTNLRTLLAQGTTLSFEDKFSIVVQIAAGFKHAHRSGILHRDVRPGKIYVQPDRTVKILDFGIAHLLRPYLARPSVRWGAPIYLSPEQVQGKDYDERSDIFSAGIIFYELITGTHPFHDKDGNKALDKILYQPLQASPEQFPDTPPGVWPILLNCLQKDPDARYESMTDLERDIGGLLEEVAEDSEFMQIELQMALPRLKKAVARPGASPKLTELMKAIQNLVNSVERADYVSLNQLMRALCDQYPVINSASRYPSRSTPAALEPESGDRGRINGIPLDIDFADDSASPPHALHEESDPCVVPCWEKEPTPADGGENSPELAALRPQGPPRSEPLDLSPLELAQLSPDIPWEGYDTPSSPGNAEEIAIGAEPGQPPIREADARSGTGSIGLLIRNSLAAEVERNEPGALSARTPGESESGISLPAVDLDPQVDGTELRPESQSAAPDDSEETSLSLKAWLGLRTARTVATVRSHENLARYAVWLSVAVLALLLLINVAHKIRGAFSFGVPSTRAQSTAPSLPGSSLPARGADQSTDPMQGSEKTTVEILLKEAQRLAEQGRYEEGKVLARRILEIYPSFQPAIAALKRFDEESARVGGQRQEEARSLLSSASALLRAGRLQEAKAKIDRAEQLFPNLPQAAALRSRWEAKIAEQSQGQTGKDAQKTEATSAAEQAWSQRVEESYRQGKYPETQNLLNQWLLENPISSQARDWHARTGEVQRTLQSFDLAFNAKKYAEAMNTIARLEQLNPSDPTLSDLRRRVESRRAAAKASLTVYRLGVAATLMLDGAPVGHDGEAQDESVAVGSHTLAVSGKDGFHLEKSFELMDGEKVVLVYDTANPVLRAISDADRDLLKKRKLREQVQRIKVEHTHGIFRGSCKGELLVSYAEVQYQSKSGLHDFRLPFRDFKLKTHGRSIEISSANESWGFKAQDENEVSDLKQLWDQFEALGK